jgi:hypothetical protein
MFETRVGKGKLMVCSIDLSRELEKRPVARQLLKSTLEYMNSPAFQPGTEVAAERIMELF